MVGDVGAGKSLFCWRCAKPLHELPRLLPRLEQCRECGTDLHVCRMCRFYAPHLIGRCSHDTAEPPLDRELANFCQAFRISNSASTGEDLRRNDAAKNGLQSLFGAEPEGEAASEDRASAEEDLVKKDPLEALKGLFDK